MNPVEKPVLGMSGIAALMRSRIEMLGAGSLGRTPDREHEGMGLTAILPGDDSVLRLWRTPEGREMAQLHYADGQPVCSELDIRDPVKFAILMHNCDCGLIDAGLDAPVQAIIAAADRLHGLQAFPRPFPDDIDLGEWQGLWQPTPLALHLLALGGQGSPVQAGAQPLSEEARDRFYAASLERWRQQVADWVLGEPAPSSLGTGAAWRRLGSLEEGRAACLRMGLGNNPPFGWGKPRSNTLTPDFLSCWILESGTDGMPLVMVSNLLNAGRVFPAKGMTAEALEACRDDIDLLMTEEGLQRVEPRQRLPSGMTRPTRPG